MKLLFLIPPFVDITAPLLGIPALIAYLKSQGYHDILVKDLNIEFLEFLCTSDYLEKQALLVKEHFESLDHAQSLDSTLYEEYQDLMRLYGFCATKGYEQITSYLRILKNENTFYDVSLYVGECEAFFFLLFKLVNYKSPASISFLFYTDKIDFIPEGDHIFSRFYQEKVLPALISLKPDLVGFSVGYEVQFFHTHYLGQQIKKHYASAFIVVGGTLVHSLEEDFKEGFIDFFSFTDAYVIGEGEKPMLALLQALQDGKDLATVPNLIYKNNRNQLVTSPLSPPIPLEELPIPDLSDLPLDSYLSPKNVIPYRVSRGCYWNKCSFCSHFQTKKFSFLSARRVLDDIKTLMSFYHTNFIYFVDDALSKSFLEKFANLIITEGINVKWLANIRPEKFLTEPFIAKLAQAGCTEIYFGIESASQKILDIIHKGIHINTVAQIINDCHKHAISTKMNFISGLPYEDAEDIAKSIHFIQENAKNCDIICLTPLSVTMNTDLADNSTQYGLEITNKSRAFCTSLNFKRTPGQLNDHQIKELYARDKDLFQRFHFFSRIHHFLYTVKFTPKEFEYLTAQYFLVTDDLSKKTIPPKQAAQLQLNWKPFLKEHVIIPFKFNTAATDKEFINGNLQIQNTYNIYSLRKFNYFHAFNEKGYKLLSLFNGLYTIENIINMLSIPQSEDPIPWDSHLPQLVLHFYHSGLIDFKD